MNIAIFSPNKNPYSETFIQAHKNYLKGSIYYYYGNKTNLKLEGHSTLVSKSYSNVLRLQKLLYRKPVNWTTEQRIIKSMLVNSIDVVLVEYGNHANHLLPILKQSKIPFIVHFHGFDASAKNVLKACKNYKDVFENAAYCVAVSKVMHAQLLKLGCPKHKLVYNVYGAQPEFFDVKPKFTKKQFVAIGRFTDKKAPYYTILALKKVVEHQKDVKLIMAGDGALLNTCENLIKFYGLENNISLVGVISSQEYQNFLSESLAFVQHSITARNGDMEGTPLSVLEASLSGLPVISTYHAGIQDVIIHNKTGLLSNEHDVDTMAKHMTSLLEDFDYAKKLGAQGKKHINENFSIERHISVLQELLNNAV